LQVRAFSGSGFAADFVCGRGSFLRLTFRLSQNHAHALPSFINCGSEIRETDAQSGSFRVVALLVDRSIGRLQRKRSENLMMPAALRVSICVNVKIHLSVRTGGRLRPARPHSKHSGGCCQLSWSRGYESTSFTESIRPKNPSASVG